MKVTGRMVVTACLLLAGCATTTREKPLLTNRALSRAAAKCHVKSLGVHYSRTGKLPYGDYLIPASEIDTGPNERPSADCMHNALKGYRRDYLGQVEHEPGTRPPPRD
ncbi:hypothetical protein [Sphingomonas sp. Marseille-Q8236]